MGFNITLDDAIWSIFGQLESIVAAIQKRGKKYRVRIIRKGIPTQSKTFNTHAEALRWSRDIESQIDKGEIPSHKAQTLRTLDKTPLFHEAATHYIETHSIHKKIVRSETYRLKILIRRWGDLPIEQVDKIAILQLRDDLLKLGRSGDTINHYFNTLSKLFQMLSGDWDLPFGNPIIGIKRMPPSLGRTKRINEAIEERLISTGQKLGFSLFPAILKLAIQTGMRRGELMGLTWADIDLNRRRAYLHTTKNGEPRQVPLTKKAVAVLDELKRDDSGKVFPISLDTLRNQFERTRGICKEEWGGSGANPFNDIRFHDLRHEALSRLSDAGLNVIELSHISGHKSLGMLKRYTHPSHEAIFLKLDSQRYGTQ